MKDPEEVVEVLGFKQGVRSIQLRLSVPSSHASIGASIPVTRYLQASRDGKSMQKQPGNAMAHLLYHIFSLGFHVLPFKKG